MGDPEKTLRDNREFFIAFLLISAAFFSLYLYIIASFLAGLIPGSPRIYIPESGFRYHFNGGFFFAVFMVASFAASIFLFRKLKKKSLYWQAGMPLCIISGIIAISLVIITFYEPSNPALKPLGYAFAGEMVGYALLPAAAVYFLKFWKNTFGNISDTIITVFSIIGIIGALFVVYFLYTTITYVPPHTPERQDIFQFSLDGLIIVVCAFFYAAFLLPLIGLVFLKLGFACRKKPTEPDNNPVSAP